MTQYTKPTVLPAWAESAGGADVLQPSNAEIQAGWPLSNVPPSRKRFNWVLKYLAQGVRYILQRGIPEWDAAEDYRINDRVMGSNGKTYKCIQACVNKDPTTQTAYWTRWGFTLAEYDEEGTTPAQFDNSVKRASTAFVQRALGNIQGLTITSTTPYNMTTAQLGSAIYFGGGSSVFNLPNMAGMPVGSMVYLSSGVTATVNGYTGQLINNRSNGGGAASIVMAPQDDLVLAWTGTVWFAIGGSFVLRAGSGVPGALFGSSKSTSGYQRLPSGLILQWGTGSTAADGSIAVTFPIAFPTACVGIHGTHAGSAMAAMIEVFGTRSTTGVTTKTYNDSGQVSSGWSVFWFAIGY